VGTRLTVACGFGGWESCGRKRLGGVGGGFRLGTAQELLLLGVQAYDQTAETACVVTVEEFSGGIGERFAEAVDDAEEGVGGFARDVAVGDEGKERGEHKGKAGAGKGVVGDRLGEKAGDAFRGTLLAELGGVRGAIAFTRSGAGQAAAAAIGVCEGAHAARNSAEIRGRGLTPL